MKGQHGIKVEVITSFVLICWEILPSHRSGKRNQTMDRFNKGHCFGHEEHTHTHTHRCELSVGLGYSERPVLFGMKLSRGQEKQGPFQLSLSLCGNRGLCLWCMTTGLRGGKVFLWSNNKNHTDNTHTNPKSILKKIHFPPQPNVGVPKILLSRKFPILRRVWNGSVRMWLQ